MADAAVKLRINRRAFEQYYNVALRKHGSRRRIAQGVGVSHTLIYNILTRRDKTHVNLDTADRFEEFFEAPRGIIFVPEVAGVGGDRMTAAA